MENDDYVRNETAGNAAEFIARTLEENVHAVMDQKTYADYIATRPRAVRLGSHGLFTDEGKEVHLGDVSKELNSYEGNIWTVIISLRREDAEKLRYDSAERWRDMLRNQTVALSENFHIPLAICVGMRRSTTKAITHMCILWFIPRTKDKDIWIRKA